jgi:hypothetical protein
MLVPRKFARAITTFKQFFGDFQIDHWLSYNGKIYDTYGLS